MRSPFLVQRFVFLCQSCGLSATCALRSNFFLAFLVFLNVLAIAFAAWNIALFRSYGATGILDFMFPLSKLLMSALVNPEPTFVIFNACFLLLLLVACVKVLPQSEHVLKFMPAISPTSLDSEWEFRKSTMNVHGSSSAVSFT